MMRIALLLWYILFIPFVASNERPIQVRGLCGPVDAGRMDQVGAQWRHNWSLCTDGRFNPAGPGAECVSWVQQRSQYAEAAIVAELESWGCPSGWVGFGDEWTLQGMDPAQQVAELEWFAGVVAEYAPQCRIAFGGFLTWHPVIGLANLDHLARFGPLPQQVKAIAVDHYNWCPTWCRDWEADAELYAVMVQDAYPSLELWARETGNLLGADAALLAIGRMPTRYFDRWAWFTSYAPGWEPVSAFTADWQLTELGAAYAALEE